jgi:SAM-dependent methyltransferase
MDLHTGSFKNHLDKTPFTEENLQDLFPAHIRALASRHWTPLEITRKVLQYLVPEKEGAKVLDIGSGSGQFCLAAACLRPGAFFFGVEQRRDLVGFAEEARKKLGLQNVSFLSGNFTRLNFRKFDHFYFYNSFYENLEGTDKIDDSITHSSELYDYYNLYLSKKLAEMPPGTRIATFHSLDFEIPSCYSVVRANESSRLKFWVKENS